MKYCIFFFFSDGFRVGSDAISCGSDVCLFGVLLFALGSGGLAHTKHEFVIEWRLEIRNETIGIRYPFISDNDSNDFTQQFKTKRPEHVDLSRPNKKTAEQT